MASSSDKRRFLSLLVAPPVICAGMGLLWTTHVVRDLENVTVDWRFTSRADSDPMPHPDIALIGIGEASLKNFGRWQDWTRNIHAELLNTLGWRPPKVVAFDFFFPEPSSDTEHDLAFADALAIHPGSITGMYLDISEESLQRQQEGFEFPPINLYDTKPFSQVSGDKSALLTGPTANVPIEVIAQSAWTGSVNFPPSNIDGMRRQLPIVVGVNEEVFPSLVLQILMQYEEAHRDDVEVNLGKEVIVPKKSGGFHRIPIDHRGFHYVNYRDTNRFLIIDYYSIFVQIESTAAGAPWPDELPPISDQIVIIGQSAEGLSDLGPTPYRPLDPLFVVQATVLDSILRQDFVKQVPMPWALLVWLFLAWSTLYILHRSPIPIAIGVPVAIILSISFLAFFAFQNYSLLIPLALPVLGFVILHTAIIGDRLALELREKKRIRSMFGSYVSPQVVDQLIESGEMPQLGGHETDITMFFSDIQGFSSFSEKLTPDRLVILMNDYLSEMTEILTGKSGTLDKYIGDAIVGMFGAPLNSTSHAYDAVTVSIAIQNRQAELREKWRASGEWPEIVHHMRTRIGLNTGPAVIGNMGSSKQFNYTMMGDNVNLAARCESGAKSYGVFTMITGETYAAATTVQNDVAYRYLDKIVVKGRTQPAEVYEVVDFKSALSSDQKKCLELFAEGIQLYLDQKWDEAIKTFNAAEKLELWQPKDHIGVASNPSMVLLDRCHEMKANPPGESWDGVYRMTTK